ncbi:hypothetical protein STPYR_10078 [uncultured Stenotrophomonas sp.]|uniref:Uncharacterized protein n=1 Tax=uncultured Stenotrophomonas sp. TaxID=165438 RepID=A0A1Y5PYQ0_9GAMM|nr:hypothetical protein STPYR_10078 [uncultured Stenotrophomonas sp.]
MAASPRPHFGAAGHPDDPRMVRKGGLEPPRLAALEPKSRASTNSATFACGRHYRRPAAKNARPEGLPPGSGDKEKGTRGSGCLDLVGCQGFEPWTY